MPPDQHGGGIRQAQRHADACGVLRRVRDGQSRPCDVTLGSRLEDGGIETAHARQDHCVERETQSKSRNRQAQLPC